MSERRRRRGIRATAIGTALALISTLSWAPSAGALEYHELPKGSISGTVSIPESAPPEWLGGIWVVATREGQFPWEFHETYVDSETGRYELAGLPVGSYTVRFGSRYFNPYPEINLLDEYYGDVTQERLSVPVPVRADETTEEVDASLSLGATLMGTVTLPSGVPKEWLAGVAVSIVPVGGDESTARGPLSVDYFTSTFWTTALLPGDYLVRFDPAHYWILEWGPYLQPPPPFRGELYDDATDASRATLISLSSGETRSIHADLSLSNVFSDVSDNPRLSTYSVFASEITWLSYKDIARGYAGAGGTAAYRPYSPVTRDQMAAFLYRLAGSPAFTPPTRSPFLDVPTNYVFYKEIVWLHWQGIANGWSVPGGTEYRPFEPIKRDQMAAFLYRLAGGPSIDGPGKPSFNDVPPRGVFAAEIAWMKQSGVSTGWAVPGGAEYRPYQNVLRDQMAAFLYRFSDRYPWAIR